MGKKKSATGDLAQSVYRAIHDAIKTMPTDEAIEFVETIADHANAMAEGMREEHEQGE